jgi:hypothetical protein
VWRKMPQVILQFPYAGVDFREDPDMVLPPGEVFYHRGMLMSLIYIVCFLDSMTCVFGIDIDTICCLFVYCNIVISL